MQKKLIVAALAGLAAAPAFAQSNVTVYGVFDVGYTSQEAKNTFTAATNAVAAGNTIKTQNTGLDGTLSGGRIGFKGTEDLGNGLKANFALEYGTNWSESTGIANTRLGWAGVSGKFGEVRIGRIQSLTKMVLDAHNPNENSTNFAPGNLDAHLGLTDVRVSNAITYMSPSFSGFQARVQLANVKSDSAAVAATGQAKDQYVNFGLNYDNGPLGVAYARNEQKTGSEGVAAVAGTAGKCLSTVVGDSTLSDVAAGATCGATTTRVTGSNPVAAVGEAKAKTTAQVLAVKYNLGVATPFYSRTERDSENEVTGAKTVDSSVDTIGVTVPMGNLKLVAQYADGKTKAVGNVAKIDHKAYQLLGVYSLSKRTNVYGIYGSTESKSATVKYELDGFALGLRHSF